MFKLLTLIPLQFLVTNNVVACCYRKQVFLLEHLLKPQDNKVNKLLNFEKQACLPLKY